ncbi:MAG TPA: late competence development ComFB family protein [Firmicutes bacterium]|nr:late competence development ComFB family protein [Bacillota bacterium]
MEEAVASLLPQVAQRFPDACLCPRCRLDIMALALNSLPPRYVVTEEGEVYARTASLSQQYTADLTTALCRAFALVGASPRHQTPAGADR